MLKEGEGGELARMGIDDREWSTQCIVGLATSWKTVVYMATQMVANKKMNATQRAGTLRGQSVGGRGRALMVRHVGAVALDSTEGRRVVILGLC